MKNELPFWNISHTEVISLLESNSDTGLAQIEVNKRLLTYGTNSLSEVKPVSKLLIFYNQFKSIIVVLLLITSIISFLLGETTEAFSIFIVILINSIIGAVTEIKAISSVESLKKLGTTRTQVIRDSIISLIDSTELVPGDIINLEAGDSVPADLRILESSNLSSNESILTGESLPVEKNKEIISNNSILIYYMKEYSHFLVPYFCFDSPVIPYPPQSLTFTSSSS